MADNFPPPISQAISLAYKVNPALGGQMRTAAEEMWGDPPAIRAHARSSDALATYVDNTVKDIKADIRSLGEDWGGSAADAYKNWMQTLNDESLQVLSGQFKRISTILDSTADDVSAMNQEFTELCGYFVATIISLAGSSKLGQISSLAALAFSVQFYDRLVKFQNAYIEKLRPRTQALREISTEIDNGSIGRRVQHPPDLGHPFPYYTQQFADPYQWHILGDWRNWKMKNSRPGV